MAQKIHRLKSLKFRFIFCFALFITLLCVIITLNSINQTLTVANKLFAEQGFQIVEQAAALIKPDDFTRLTKTLDDEDPYFLETQREMLELKNNSTAVFVYTMARVSDTEYMYIIDGSDEIGGDDFSPLGTVEDVSEFDSGFFKTIQDKTREYSDIVDQGDWGWLASVYTPILDAQNNVIGIIGCDFKAGELHEIIVSNIIRFVLISSVFFIIGIALTILLTFIIFTPIQNVNMLL
jgi:methyl-accepting chemotaxis protein